MRSFEDGDAGVKLRFLPVIVVMAVITACAGQANPPASDASPMESGATEAELTAEDYHGTYDLYLGGPSYDQAEGRTPAMTAEWRPGEFVAFQNGSEAIRTDISIDPEAGEIRLWDDTSSDVLCSSEGVYDYEDDGTTITLELDSDPCENRAVSADGARLVRR